MLKSHGGDELAAALVVPTPTTRTLYTCPSQPQEDKRIARSSRGGSSSDKSRNVVLVSISGVDDKWNLSSASSLTDSRRCQVRPNDMKRSSSSKSTYL